MKKRDFKNSNKRYSKKISIDMKIEDQEYNISFSLTPKETKKYFAWLNAIIDSMEIDEDEDPFLLPVKFQFSPYEMGTTILASVFDKEIVLRYAVEDDEI